MTSSVPIVEDPGKSALAEAMRLVGYPRVSTEGQANGYGLDTQRAEITRWSKANGHRIVRWCSDEGVSGTVEGLDREGLGCVIETVESGEAEGLVFTRLDRLARALHTQEAALAHIWRAGGRAFATDGGEIHENDPDDPMRKGMRLMMGVFAEIERDMIAMRMRKGRIAKAAAGGYAYGSPAYGTKAEDGVLVTDASEAAVLAQMKKMREHQMSLRAIAEVLNADGVPTKRGGRWAPSTVSRLLDPAARDRDRRMAAKRREGTASAPHRSATPQPEVDAADAGSPAGARTFSEQRSPG